MEPVIHRIHCVVHYRDNKVYGDWDFDTNKLKADSKFDPAKPINDSPNNTGLRELPPTQKAFIWYPYANSPEFPLVGSSGRSATGGPVFRKADFKNAPRPFPDYYEGKWLAVDFMRGWIMAITMDEKGAYKSMERFMPSENFSSAIDMDFSPDGDLYVLEYGSAWFRGNDNARLVKVQYNAEPHACCSGHCRSQSRRGTIQSGILIRRYQRRR